MFTGKLTLRVLFICTGNSCRSQMAEGFARAFGGGEIEAYSAGTHPSHLNPIAVEVMAERGIDISAQQSKYLTDVPQHMDVVITVCDDAAEACPMFPGAERLLHWSLPDPAAAEGTPDEIKAVFHGVRDALEERVRSLVEELRERNH